MASGKIKIPSSGGGSVTIQTPDGFTDPAGQYAYLANSSGNLITTSDVGTVTPDMLVRKLTFHSTQVIPSNQGWSVWFDFRDLPWGRGIRRITFLLHRVKLSGTAMITGYVYPKGPQ